LAARNTRVVGDFYEVEDREVDLVQIHLSSGRIGTVVATPENQGPGVARD
jgi:hypothetical protein